MTAGSPLTSKTEALIGPVRVALDALKEQPGIDQAALDRVRAMKLAATFEIQELAQTIAAAITELLSIGRELDALDTHCTPTRRMPH